MLKDGKLFTIEQLDNILTAGNVFLYGAGRVAKTVVKYAAKKNIEINKIFVSDKEKNPDTIMGVFVEEIERSLISPKSILLICTMENLHDEIDADISEYDFQGTYYISDELYNNLVYVLGDFEIEILYEINELRKNVLQPAITQDKILWENMWEREIVRENWGNITDMPDFAEKYQKLIHGLDAKSIETVVRILNRQKQYLNTERRQLDLFTKQEQTELQILEEDFQNLIIKLSDDLYMYKHYLLPGNYFEASVFFYKHGIEKVKNINCIKGRIVVDVGDFVGDSVLILSELLPERIITFEAVPEHYKLLNKTIRLNHLDDVTAINCALGKKRETMTMNLAGSCSTVTDRKGIDFNGVIEVPVISLDEYVKEQKLEDIGLIKVDIEGGEPDFLLGAKETIAKFKPILLISIYHNAHDFFELKPMIEEWDLGYHFSIYKPTNGNLTNETMLIAEM